ncbi:MAG: lytic transglycosylase domain-containing protein [Candidatus Nanopelagicaceae bacterium]
MARQLPPQELQLQQGYQSPIQAQAYNPLQVADASQQMEQNRATALANAQREDTVLSKSDEAAIEFAKGVNAQQLADLSSLSTSLQKVTTLGAQEYWKAEAKRGINAIRESGVPFQEYFDWHKTKRDLEITQAGGDALANQAMAAGEPFEVANLYKGLSGIAKIYAKEEIARQGADAYLPWMQNQLQTNNTLILRTKDGEEFTPDKTGNDPIKRAQAVRALDDLFVEQFGFLGINRVVLQDHAFEKMNKGRTQLIGEARFNFAQEQSAATRETAMVLLRQGNYLGAVRALASTVDGEGRHIGYTGAHDQAMKMLSEIDKAGLLEDTTFQAILGQEDPDSGKTVGKRWEVRFAQFEKDRAARVRADAAAEQGDREVEAQKAENEFRELFDNDPNQRSESNIKAAQERYFFLSGGKKSPYLEGLASEYSVTAKAKQELNDRFEKLAEQNLLTTDMVAQAPWSVQTKWMPAAKQQEAGRTTTFKTHLKAIENHVKTDPRVKVSPDGSTSGMATLVIGELQAKFNRKVSEYVATGKLNAAQAANQAVAEVMSEFKTDPRYAMNNMGEFSSFTLGTAKTSAAINHKLNTIRSAVLGGGKASLNKKPGLIFNASQLKAMEEGYGEAGWSMPLEAQYWGSKLGISGLEVINRQREAAGMRPLITPESMEVANNAMSSQMQALLNRLPTYNRSVRALSSMGRFEPTMVPKGFGTVIQKAARANGIDPAILTGILEVESSWRDDIIYGRTKSEAGARGIAQIMPEYHPGVNYDDPIASINYAAKHLKGLIAATNGDVNRAIQAYNAGLGGIGKSQENRNYLPLVLKSAAKYGYGQAWRDPATMRPSVVYKIGSLGYGSTAPHLDLKRVARGTTSTTSSVEIKPTEVDNFVEVNVNGKWKALSKGAPINQAEKEHRARGSFGVDYLAPAGTPVRLTNGAKVVGTYKGEENSDILIIELPDGRRFQFLHGTKV